MVWTLILVRYWSRWSTLLANVIDVLRRILRWEVISSESSDVASTTSLLVWISHLGFQQPINTRWMDSCCCLACTKFTCQGQEPVAATGAEAFTPAVYRPSIDCNSCSFASHRKPQEQLPKKRNALEIAGPLTLGNISKAGRGVLCAKNNPWNTQLLLIAP